MQAQPARFLERPSDPGSPSLLAAWLADLARRPEHRGALAHWEKLPPRAARFADLSRPLPAPLVESLAHQGIERLYVHQARAIESLRDGRDTVVLTGTASGKSL